MKKKALIYSPKLLILPFYFQTIKYQISQVCGSDLKSEPSSLSSFQCFNMYFLPLIFSLSVQMFVFQKAFNKDATNSSVKDFKKLTLCFDFKIPFHFPFHFISHSTCRNVKLTGLGDNHLF